MAAKKQTTNRVKASVGLIKGYAFADRLKAFNVYRPAKHKKGKMKGILQITETKETQLDKYGSQVHSVYRDEDMTVVVSPKQLVIRANFSKVSKGMFTYEYIYEDGKENSYIRNIARHIDMTDSEVFELALLNKIVNVDKDLALEYGRDIFDYLTSTGHASTLCKRSKDFGMYDFYREK